MVEPKKKASKKKSSEKIEDPDPGLPVVIHRPKLLKWEDFQAEAPTKVRQLSRYSALTALELRYSYDVKISGEKVILKVQAEPIFNKKMSWYKSPSDELLKHEQGHFDLVFVYSLEFKKRVQEEMETFTVEDYEKRVAGIYRQIWKEQLQLQRKYDDETDHSVNRKDQEKWDELIQKMILTRYSYIK